MKKYCDGISEVCHEIIKDGHRLGIITDEEKKEFEADCFVSEPEKSQAVPKTVILEHASA